MKDEKLEKQFEEYFKGVKTPDDITDDAKKYIARKRAVMPKIVKFASIAASFVLVFAAAIALIMRNNALSPAPDNAGTPQAPSASVATYGDGELDFKDADAYTVNKLNRSLSFVRTLAIANNADVSGLQTAYRQNELTLVKADLSLINGLSRHDTKVYVEFTSDDLVYDELLDFNDGGQYSYRGIDYYLTRTVAENGEPETKLSFSYNGAKYYFDVTSADRAAHLSYLKMIIK